MGLADAAGPKRSALMGSASPIALVLRAGAVVDEPASASAMDPTRAELRVEGVEDFAAYTGDREVTEQREDVGTDQLS